MTGTASSNKPSFTSFFLHLHPRKVPVDTIRFTLSYGLGGMGVVLVTLLVMSGVLQLLSYSPDVDSAYQSILAMYKTGSPSGFIRNVHHWAGNLLVIVSFFHLLRVYLTGAIDKKRRLNWLVGICLFLLVLFANFTGYLLPWDQLAFWAVTIFTHMVSYIPFVGGMAGELLRGGNEVGGTTLDIFFAIHAGIVPFVMIVLLIFHFWLVRKGGGLIRSEKASPEKVVAVPVLVSREVAVGLGLSALLLLFAAIVDAPLAEMANPGESPNPAKAAWYFMGLQELLLHFHPTFAICFIPALVLVFIAALPFIDGATLSPGIWCGGLRGRALALFACFVSFAGTILLVIFDDKVLRSADTGVHPAALVSRGVMPLAVILSIAGLCYFVLRRRGVLRSESLMVLFMSGIGMILGLTAIGIWFRGEGMTLILSL